MKRGKKIRAGIFMIAAAGVLLLGYNRYSQEQMREEIADKIIRFHVLANSDSAEDQQLKLKVRDGIGTYMQPRLSGITDIDRSRSVVKESLRDIEKEAEHIIAEEGYTYGVSARLARTDFPEKTYGPYTFQAGNYEALEVVIGEGNGHNWWCVMYPNLCFFNSTYEVVDKKAEKSLEQTLTPEEYKSLMENKEYEIKFALTDFWEDIKEAVAISK